MTRLTLRLDFGDKGSIGHGKIRMLELIGEHGSISAAGKAMGMSYRRAWLLVDDINQTFRRPAVQKMHGGSHGGGAELTEFGHELVSDYRAMEAEATKAFHKRLRRIESVLA
ncbi:MAG: winged helix-turn-helix domain-containing protein [Rhodospirillales bacterium]